MLKINDLIQEHTQQDSNLCQLKNCYLRLIKKTGFTESVQVSKYYEALISCLPKSQDISRLHILALQFASTPICNHPYQKMGLKISDISTQVLCTKFPIIPIKKRWVFKSQIPWDTKYSFISLSAQEPYLNFHNFVFQFRHHGHPRG